MLETFWLSQPGGGRGGSTAIAWVEGVAKQRTMHMTAPTPELSAQSVSCASAGNCISELKQVNLQIQLTPSKHNCQVSNSEFTRFVTGRDPDTIKVAFHTIKVMI